MDTTPLPTQDRDLSGSDQQSLPPDDLAHYLVRITPYEKFTFKELQDFLELEALLMRYVVSQELKPQIHYHLVLTTDESVQIQDIKDIVRAFIFPLWQKNGKLPLGFGNKQYNCQEAENLDNAISYALKDKKEYIQVGYEQKYIDERIQASFQKNSTKTFTTELQELQKNFQESDMDISEYMTKFIQLKSRYGQMINLQHAYQYALSQLIQRNPEQAQDFVDNYLYKQ